MSSYNNNNVISTFTHPDDVFVAPCVAEVAADMKHFRIRADVGTKRKKADSPSHSSESKRYKPSRETELQLLGELRRQARRGVPDWETVETLKQTVARLRRQLEEANLRRCNLCLKPNFPYGCLCHQEYGCDDNDVDDRLSVCNVVVCKHHQCQPCMNRMRRILIDGEHDDGSREINLAKNCWRHYCQHCRTCHDIDTRCPRFCRECDAMVKENECTHKCHKCFGVLGSGTHRCTRSANGRGYHARYQ